MSVEYVKMQICVLAHIKLIVAIELYRKRAFFLSNNLYSVFIASFMQAEIEENLCEETNVTLLCDVRN